jgi:hypothetical protein
VNKISLQKNLAIVASSFGAFSNSPFLHSRVKKISLKKTKSKLRKKFGHSGPPYGAFSNSPFPHTKITKFEASKDMYGGPIYDKLSNALRRYCPDFEQPTHWSSIVRKTKTRLNKGKDLEEPIFSKGKVSDIGPC